MRAAITSTWDALGNTTENVPTLINQVDVLLPATGQSGTGRTRL